MAAWNDELIFVKRVTSFEERHKNGFNASSPTLNTEYGKVIFQITRVPVSPGRLYMRLESGMGSQ